mmetsp:Transcript_23639/g.55954  ORF Transcript_23639/g.55954 Transcript_23639/m.55954 type:complete len:454 (-) Transcript_23639:63-1424(-)
MLEYYNQNGRWRDVSSSSSSSRSSGAMNTQKQCLLMNAVLIIMFATNSSSMCHAFAAESNNNPWNSNLVSSARLRNQQQQRRDTPASSAPTASASGSSASSSALFSSSVVNGNDVQVVDDSSEDNDDVKLTTSEVLSLESIRSSLIRQEETIIFALIERAQFRQNLKVYQPGALLGHSDNEDESFLQYMMMGTEALHATVRRYMSPEEHAFFPDRLPKTKQGRVLEDLDFPNLLSDTNGAASENFNPILLKKYVEWVVPSICEPGDDEQHGSTALCDTALLQALSKRIHYGKFVAESKFLSDPDEYKRLVENNDADGVMKLLTNQVVEAKVLRRARLKAATYGQEPLLAELPPLPKGNKEMTTIVAAAAASAVVAAIEAMDNTTGGSTSDATSTASSTGLTTKVCPATVESIYRDLVIPLTKDVEVAYLFRRCGREPPPEYAPDRMSVDICTK